MHANYCIKPVSALNLAFKQTNAPCQTWSPSTFQVHKRSCLDDSPDTDWNFNGTGLIVLKWHHWQTNAKYTDMMLMVRSQQLMNWSLLENPCHLLHLFVWPAELDTVHDVFAQLTFSDYISKKRVYNSCQMTVHTNIHCSSTVFYLSFLFLVYWVLRPIAKPWLLSKKRLEVWQNTALVE